jgi:hypothetical protein
MLLLLKTSLLIVPADALNGHDCRAHGIYGLKDHVLIGGHAT